MFSCGTVDGPQDLVSLATFFLLVNQLTRAGEDQSLWDRFEKATVKVTVVTVDQRGYLSFRLINK